jgi:methionine aminopeptidase
MNSYVKALPLELLPTFWSPDELQLLIGTTLAPATASKLRSLRREWDLVCESAARTRWHRICGSQLDFDDWLQVDAMYRSRALDYPQIGHCMVPCVDLANHVAHEGTIAIYEKDAAGNAVLVLRDGKTLQEGDEVTISYGDEKGACEMLFSYGFLDQGMETAETLFLSLAFQEDDTMRAAKLEMADCAPGFKLIDAGDGEVDWTGEFVWLICVGEDDGLHFDIARTVDGNEEVQAFFKDHELTGGAAELYRLLGQSEMFDVYRLRAVMILQQRVFDQMQVLFASQEDMEAVPHGDGTDVRQQAYDQAMQLRRLEFELMERAYEDFEKQVRVFTASRFLQSHDGQTDWSVVGVAQASIDVVKRRASGRSSSLAAVESCVAASSFYSFQQWYLLGLHPSS